MTIRSIDDHRIHDYLDRHDPDLVLAAHRDQKGGPAHMRRLGALARSLIRSGARPTRILDLFCGAGDFGRMLGLLEPGSRVDFVDPDPFALALCARINRRRRTSGRLFTRDLWQWDWDLGLDGEYDVIAVHDGLGHLDSERATQVLEELASMLREGGQLVLCETTTRTGREYLRLVGQAGFNHAEVVCRDDDRICLRAVHEGWVVQAA